MAEYCKECFIKKILTTDENKEYEDGLIEIVETNFNDLCEGCGKFVPVVDYIIIDRCDGAI